MIPKVKKAVFPAAGYGTRFLPATKSQPKEMLPIVDKPVIQYLVEEAVASGITEIVIVTGRGKRAIEDHFDYSFELESNLVEKGKHNLLKEVRKIANLAKFIYVRQSEPLGDGHAILCAEEVLKGEPFAVLFGDDIVDGPRPAIGQLLDIYNKVLHPVIGLTKVPKQEIGSYGVIAPKKTSGRLHEIASLVEKPSPEKAPSNLAIIGKYVVTPDIFRALKKAKHSRDSEIRLIDGFRELIKSRPLYGYEIEGTRYDTGDKLGLVKATIDFALKRPDIGPALKKFLSTRG